MDRAGAAPKVIRLDPIAATLFPPFDGRGTPTS
jgi:hypothetical protein